jgi:outer membrane protein assembly factor BamB
VLAFEGATTAKRLLAVDRESGQCLWRTPFEVTGCALTADASRGFTWRPGAGGGQDLVAVDLAGGHVAWERTAHDLGRMAAGVSLVVAGDALCWTVGSHVAAVDAARGTPRWHTSLDRAGTLSVPATDGTAVFVASAAGVWALAADSGHALWHVADSGSRFQPAPPAVYCDGQALVVATGRFTGRGNLRCHDPATGAVRWHRDVAAPLHSLTLAGDVFVRCGRVRAFSGATGAPLWSAPLDGCGPVVLSQRRLYTTEGQGHAALVALDARNGMRVWQRHLADSCSGLVVIDRMGFLASNDGSLYALNVGWSG